jgi:hypothetical protein
MERMMMKALLAACLAVLVLVPPALAQGSGGATGPSIYVDGVLFRTVGTPTDLSGTGAPASTFDTLYDFQGAQAFNVATAGPGDAGYNGGRWMVHGLSFADYDAALAEFDDNGSGDFDSDEEVLAAVRAGAATDVGVIKAFECPLLRVA